jgi:hypothetical protein
VYLYQQQPPLTLTTTSASTAPGKKDYTFYMSFEQKEPSATQHDFAYANRSTVKIQGHQKKNQLVFPHKWLYIQVTSLAGCSIHLCAQFAPVPKKIEAVIH